MTEKMILELIEKRNFKEIKEILNDMNEVDIAHGLIDCHSLFKIHIFHCHNAADTILWVI